MPSSFHGISMASNALRAFQRSLEVTGNNIANVNTPGYSRQRVNFQQQAPVDFWMRGVHRLGQGVTIGSIDRARDLFVDRNASRNFSEQGSLGAAKAAFDQIDRIYGEPSDSGISAALGRLFDSFSNLGSDPANQGYRLEVRRAGMALADRISSAGEDLNRLGAELRTEASGDFAEINRLGEEIGRLNREVVAAQALGGPPADLLDRRQAALDGLSKLIRIEAVQQPSGSVTVNAAGQILAD
ncbi:MAG: flagellar hook-associated protein FlgK [Fimbriimonadaceae bacterium]|nr:flagellar hook-associated protein FlgK [Fimbriimonadaceae bacterium]